MSRTIGLILFAVSIIGCQTETVPDSLFKTVPSSVSGLTFSNTLTHGSEVNIIEYLYYYNGGGVGIGDFNGDGLEDIYLSANQSSDKIYLNKGNLKFEDITAQSGIIIDKSWSNGVSVDDVNGDGHLDIYVAQVAKYGPGGTHNRLYINNGDATFTEQAEKYNLDFSGYGTHSTFLDYDKDGDLDVYLLNHAVHSVRSYGDTTKRLESDSLSGDLFLENRVSEIGKFVDVTDEVGVFNSPLGYGLAVAAADLNDDGYTDIYVGNDFHENDYLHINNGNKTFTETTKDAFTHTTQFSMGVDVSDINGDGQVDIFTTDMLPYDPTVLLKSGGEDTDQVKRIKSDLGFENQDARNHLQLGKSSGTFQDVGYATETFATDWSWSVLVQDFNKDQLTDIFITNGIVRRPNDLDYINYLNEYDSYQQNSDDTERAQKLIAAMPSQPLENILFTQNDNFTFSKISKSKIGTPSFSTGAAYADFDLDGDLDIISNNINQEVFLYENTAKDGRSVTLDLVEKSTSKTTKGAKVELYHNGQKHVREMQTTRGFLSSSTHRLYFGLGDVKSVDSILVKWPDGTKQKVVEVILDEVNIISKEGKIKYSAKEKPIDSFKTTKLPIAHIENQYFDENTEKLIPEKLSMEGPATLVEDLDGDDINDIFLGGGRGQSSKIYKGLSDGSYKNVNIKAFENDARYEDVDVALIDFDKDGDKDLYVVSGGNDYNELNKILEDRLYLNNGNGDYKRIPLSLPHTNGSCVSVADFDKDGYEDIFVGARSIPSSYGLSPYSFVLKNLDGQGVDISYKVRYGMVTDAEWVDLDQDDDMDLVICGDWMSIKVLENIEGDLIDQSDSLGLSNENGLWNALSFADLNKDGKLDIVAGNAGLNHKWKASKANPIKLYVGDIDNNGASDPMIFYKFGERYIPFSGLPKLTSHIPSFRKKFKDYKSFAFVDDISDLVEDEKLLIEHKTITELRSKVYLSSEQGYIGHQLPNTCQYSTINDIMIEGDKIYYVGNSNTFVADLGNVVSNAGGVLDNIYSETPEQFNNSSLSLPANNSYRKILKIEDNKILVSSNNSHCYLIEEK